MKIIIILSEESSEEVYLNSIGDIHESEVETVIQKYFYVETTIESPLLEFIDAQTSKKFVSINLTPTIFKKTGQSGFTGITHAYGTIIRANISSAEQGYMRLTVVVEGFIKQEEETKNNYNNNNKEVQNYGKKF